MGAINQFFSSAWEIFLSIPVYIFIIGAYVLLVDYFLDKKRGFTIFIGRKKKNFWSIVIINLMAWAAIIVVYYEQMETGWKIFCYVFMSLIIFLSWYRVWLIYKKVEKVNELYPPKDRI